MAPKKTLESNVSNNAAAKLLQPKDKGNGVGKGFNLRQALRMSAELVKQPSLQSTPYGTVVKQLMVGAESGPVQLYYICPHAWLYFACLQHHT